MGKEIASLYATLGVNDQSLKTGLANAKSGLGTVATGFEKVTGVSLKTATAWGLAAKAGQEVVAAVKKAVDQTVAYNYAMMEGAKITGMAVEEYSAFVQVADDAFLSQEKLTTALQFAARKGLDTNIEGIKRLADEYSSLGTQQEKNKFLAENFGRQGLEMYKVLELESTGISKAMGNIDKSLIVTAKAANNTKLFKESVDALNDSMQGLWYTVGNDVIPTASDFALVMSDIIERTKDTGIGFKDILIIFQALNPLMVPIVASFKGIIDVTADYADEIRKRDGQLKNFVKHFGDELPSAMKITEEELAKLEDKFSKTMLSLADSITGVEQDYNDNVKENNDELLTLMEERAKLISQGYSPQSKAIKDIDDALDANAQKAEDNAIAHEKATHRIVLSYLEQVLAADGLTQDEVQFLIDKGIAWGIYDEDVRTIMNNVITEAGNLTSAINGIPTSKTIDITTVYHTVNAEGGHNAPITVPKTSFEEEMAAGGSFGIKPHAAGNSWMIPASMGYENYQMPGHTASGGEMVSVSNTKQIGDIMTGLAEATRLLKNLPAAMQRSVRDGMLQGA